MEQRTFDDDKAAVPIAIAPRTIVHVVLALLAIWLLQALWTVVVVILVALVVAGAVVPLVHVLERHRVKRSVALAIIYLSAFVILIGLLFLAVPPLVSQLLDILEHAPEDRAKVVAWLSDHRFGKQLAQSIESIPLDHIFASAAKRLLSYSPDVLTALGYGITTMFLSVYLIADSRRVTGGLYALVPRTQHMKLARIIANLETIVGGYIRGQIITSVAITAFTFVLLTTLGVADALSLSIFAGLTDVVPFVGGLLASAPAVLASIATGPVTAITVLIAMFIYQEFESRVLVPRLYGRVLRMSPALVLVALLAGGTLLGILGALLALPVAAGLQMIVSEIRVDLPGDDVHDARQQVRDDKADATYERLSAGVDAVAAAQIATNLERKIRHDGG